MQPDEVASHIANSVDVFLGGNPSSPGWEELLDTLERWFLTLDSSCAFLGALLLLKGRNRYQHHLVAGELMLRRGDPMPISFEEFISAVAPTVETSADTVGRYIEQQFGRSNAVEKLRTLKTNATNPDVHAGIDAFRYWLGDHPGMEP